MCVILPIFAYTVLHSSGTLIIAIKLEYIYFYPFHILSDMMFLTPWSRIILKSQELLSYSRNSLPIMELKFITMFMTACHWISF